VSRVLVLGVAAKAISTRRPARRRFLALKRLRGRPDQLHEREDAPCR
jgi:hypothetical protein